MKHNVWTNADTKWAKRQFRELMGWKKRPNKLARTISTTPVAEPVPVADAELAKELVNIARIYNRGFITTKNFLAVVRDIAGGV